MLFKLTQYISIHEVLEYVSDYHNYSVDILQGYKHAFNL